MSALDDLQTKARAAKSALDTPEGTLAELDSDTIDVADQFVALGNEGSAQVLSHAASGALSTVREHLAHAHAALDDYISACEQAKGAGGG
ncbi:MAG: hypothetical protein GEV10_23950 [Streptosporangiales bacterium]|nr:hypothetical protein [Streptosporangiales bacterium]